MDEHVEQVAGELVSDPATRRNRGWFQPADRRINREGRPYGSKTVASTDVSPDLAVRPDRVKRLFVPERDLAWRLTRQFAPWYVNLPGDFEIVACRVDSHRSGVIFIIRSESFPRIAKGTPVPDLVPAFHGLRWRRL
jgi:hypothetical protein